MVSRWKGAVLLTLLQATHGLSNIYPDRPTSSKGIKRPLPTPPESPKDDDTGGQLQPREGLDELKVTRKKKVGKRLKQAPAVDSTLLRFMWGAQQNQSSCDEYPGSDPSMSDKDDSGSSDFENCSSVLQSLGVEKWLSREAGRSVDRHLLGTAARSRVRGFLRQRDMIWLSDDAVSQGKGEPEGYINGDARSNQSSGFKEILDVLSEHTLSPTDAALVLIHTPDIVLMVPRPTETDASSRKGETLDETTRKVFRMLTGSLRLRPQVARKVLRRAPGLLTPKGCERAESVLRLLMSLGVSIQKVAKDDNELPKLLTRSPSALFRLIAFFSSDSIRMSTTRIADLFKRKDLRPLLDAVAPGRVWVRKGNNLNQQAMESQHAKERLVSERNQTDRVYRKMLSTASTLRYEIGTEDLGKVISAYPGVLFLDAETRVLPTARYLVDRLGIDEDDLPSVLQLYPFLLGKERDEMEEVVSYLLSLEVSEENLPRMLRAFPALLSMDVEEDMKPVVEFLREIGISNVGRFVSRLPPVLGYSVQTELRPKWEYVSSVCLYPSFELSAFPAFFSYPLERVIKSRFDYLRRIKKIPTQLLALDLVVRYGDRDFATMVANDRDDGLAFAKFLRQRGGKKDRRPTKYTRSRRRRRRGSKS